jgi:hypothetical protein
MLKQRSQQHLLGCCCYCSLKGKLMAHCGKRKLEFWSCRTFLRRASWLSALKSKLSSVDSCFSAWRRLSRNILSESLVSSFRLFISLKESRYCLSILSSFNLCPFSPLLRPNGCSFLLHSPSVAWSWILSFFCFAFRIVQFYLIGLCE